MSNIVRDYYTVKVPGDLASTVEALGQHAITEASERARIAAIPANWTAVLVSGELGDFEVTFRVCRRRNRVAK